MELIDTIGLIVFVSIGILVPAGAAYKFYQQKKMHWRILAKKNRLKYTRTNWFKGGDFVYGHFRDYYLKLETTRSRIGDEEGYTHIVLAANQSSRLISPPLNQSEDTRSIGTRLGVFRSSQVLRGQITGGEDPIIVCYEQDGIETDVKYLQSVINLLGNIAEAYSLALSFEGRAIAYLREAVLNEKSELSPVIIQLLDDILQIVSSRLKRENVRLFCRNCLTNYDIHNIRLAGRGSFSYYGCRICQESWNYLAVNKVVALLDAEHQEGKYQENDLLLINWSVERRLFDFDEIIIVQASDEDVERFAVQIGNDTDGIRKPIYKDIRCTISPGCKLSENTLRILRRMIGQVEIKEVDSSKMLISVVRAT